MSDRLDHLEYRLEAQDREMVRLRQKLAVLRDQLAGLERAQVAQRPFGPQPGTPTMVPASMFPLGTIVAQVQKGDA